MYEVYTRFTVRQQYSEPLRTTRIAAEILWILSGYPLNFTLCDTTFVPTVGRLRGFCLLTAWSLREVLRRRPSFGVSTAGTWRSTILFVDRGKRSFQNLPCTLYVRLRERIVGIRLNPRLATVFMQKAALNTPRMRVYFCRSLLRPRHSVLTSLAVPHSSIA